MMMDPRLLRLQTGARSVFQDAEQSQIAAKGETEETRRVEAERLKR